jgi:hypothetical protein
MNRFWGFITRAAAPLALVALTIAVVLAVWSNVETRSLGRCVDHWAAEYVQASTDRANAHDVVQTALDTLIRAVPTTDSPGSAANFEKALDKYIAASNAEQHAEKTHPLPAAPTLDC